MFYCPKKTVSRSHFPILLSKVDGEEFSKSILDYYGIELSAAEKKWFGGDGKELKGSILKGDKRGEAIVQLVAHEDRQVLGETFFNGAKKSEVKALRFLLKSDKVAAQKLSMDALHFKPKTLQPIVNAGGIFLVGLKKNQKKLYLQMVDDSVDKNDLYQRRDKPEKGHGRIENRYYECYDISKKEVAERWSEIGFQTLIRVERKREIVNTGKKTHEVCYFLSNMKTKNMQTAYELFDAVRSHWQIEVSNNRRDCTLKEDKMRCTDTRTARTIASCRTLTVKILQKSEVKNKCELMDNFADDFDQCIQWLKKINFL